MPFVCPHCGRTSHHPQDLAQRYCGFCHVFVDDVQEAATWRAAMQRRQADIDRLLTQLDELRARREKGEA